MDVDLEKIKIDLHRIDQVSSLHHTHIWSQDGEHHVFSTHVRLNNIESIDQLSKVRKKINDTLEEYDFEHITVEIELDQWDCSVKATH